MRLSKKKLHSYALFNLEPHSPLDLSLRFARHEGSYTLQVEQPQNLGISYVNIIYTYSALDSHAFQLRDVVSHTPLQGETPLCVWSRK